MDLREIFRRNVKSQRKKRKLSQEKLAELCDLSTIILVILKEIIEKLQ